MRLSIRLLLLNAFLVLFSSGDASAVTTLTSRTAGAVIFKDGYCMVIKKVTGLIDSDRKSIIKEIPANAVLGSFWVQTEDGKPVSMVVRQQIVPRAGKNETEKQLELNFDPGMPEGQVSLSFSYFGPGIRWIPTYRIELSSSDKARLLMQAEILNELEDLENVPLDLVVGVPNFRFKDVASPLSLESRLSSALQSSAPQLAVQSMSNMMTQRAGEFNERSDMAGNQGSYAPELPQSLSGESAQDLFVFKVKDVFIRTGERAATALIASDVPIRHVYTWDVRLKHAGSDNFDPTGSNH
ncbi:MAG: hypothetical protein AB1403_25180, partial [Candidatus Riflebacteria bacterium]